MRLANGAIGDWSLPVVYTLIVPPRIQVGAIRCNISTEDGWESKKKNGRR